MKREHICIRCMSNKGVAAVCPGCGYDHRSYKRIRNHIPPLTVLNSRYLPGLSLGQGGIGITYIAYDLQLHQTVVIKELFLKNICERDENLRVSVSKEYRQCFLEYRKNFLREVRELTRMTAAEEISAVVRGLDYFEQNNTVYFVMEYIEGETLESYVKRKKHLSRKESLRLLWPVLESVMQLHSQNVIHKDIRPGNMIIYKKNAVKLLDFGGSVVMDDADRSHILSPRNGYTPPEQCKAVGRVGPWTDVYAAAATLYFCVMGRPPADLQEIGRQQNMVFDEEFLRRFKRADKAMQIAMQPNHVKRYQTMNDFMEELIGFHKQKSRKSVWIPAGLTAAAGLFLGCFFLTRLQKAEPPVVYELTDGIYRIRNMSDRSLCLGVEEGYPDDKARLCAMNPTEHNYNRFQIHLQEETAMAEISACHTDSRISLEQYEEDILLLQDSAAEDQFQIEVLNQAESGDYIVKIYTADGLALCMNERTDEPFVTAEEPDDHDSSQQWMLTETVLEDEEKVAVLNKGDAAAGMSGEYLISDSWTFSEFLAAKTNISGEYPIVAMSSDVRADSPYWTLSEQETEGEYTLRADPDRVGDAGYLELIPESRALAMNIENHTQNQRFKIVYGGRGAYMIQTADEGYMVRKPEALTLDQSGVGSDFFEDTDMEELHWYIVRNASTNIS